MIKRKAAIRKEDVQKLLFNFAGVAILIGVGYYMLHSAVFREEIAQCSKRFPIATELSLFAPDGHNLTPIEFQSILSADSQNILENAEIVHVDGDQAAAALKVRVGDRSRNDADGERQISGVKFHWAPSSFESSNTGCLTYNVMLPENFDFSRAGSLPGFRGDGNTVNDVGKAQDFTFASRIGWNDAGRIAVKFAREGDDRNMRSVGWLTNKVFKPGRWVALEQEFIANTPQIADGTYRLWVDGSLVLENDNVEWAPRGSAKLVGVTGAVGYIPKKNGQSDDDDANPQIHFVHVTPFQFRWQ